ncbi:uncharacterized protein LOC114263275 [Camellia sinensis]|uniref:Uncharacterized protein n=1 Tax=Camellia sinensis var. sinensis TaxID=542762 RepID=A0A4S4ER35_CAMSN|nr:uncharacterized protein LOC114263275 [Camellia sinensis]THG18795.1 hypothetical protein TEA_012695 [Camellia sinensis var. sinensis]
MSKKGSKESKLSRVLKSPFRVLTKARDFYIQSMSQCAGNFEYAGAMGCPTGQISTLPKSFSVSSTNSSNSEDLRDLVRIASTRSLNNKVQAELLRRQQSMKTGAVKVVPRSHSAGGIGRIDEEEACEFDQDVKVNVGAYPRSKSHAVTKKVSVF